MTGTAACADAEGSGLGGPQGSRNPYSNQEAGVAGWDRGNPAMGLPGDGVSSQHIPIICYCSLSESCPTLFYPMDAAHQASLFLLSPEFDQVNVHRVQDAIQPTYRLLPSIFPSVRVCSNESALYIRWPKYWSFSFSISPSNEYSGLFPLLNPALS